MEYLVQGRNLTTFLELIARILNMVQMLLPIEKDRRVLEPVSSDGFRGSTRRAVERSSSVNFDDIPKELVVEILCRLPSAEFLCRCKVISIENYIVAPDQIWLYRKLTFQIC